MFNNSFIEELGGYFDDNLKKNQVVEQVHCAIMDFFPSNYMVTQSMDPDYSQDDFLKISSLNIL